MSTVVKRLDALAQEHDLPDGSAHRLGALLDLLATDPTAPTTVTAPAQALATHLEDSLSGLGFEALRTASRIADLGAGAGFPGLPLAVALPAAQVTLVESATRKAGFLERAVAVLGVANVTLAPVRAEEWSDGFGTQDIVTARALAPLNVLIEYAAPLLRPGGALVAWKGRRDPAEEADGSAAAAATGLSCSEVRAVTGIRGADHRNLYLYLKVAETPPRYPRRAGMARKRPIRASA